MAGGSAIPIHRLTACPRRPAGQNAGRLVEVGMPGVPLVRCESAKQIDVDGDPCTLLCAHLVEPASDDAGGEGYRVITFSNQPDDLSAVPRPDATVCLTPYPNGRTPALIVADWKAAGIWAGPVLFWFYLYVPQFDASPFLGKVFALTTSPLSF